MYTKPVGDICAKHELQHHFYADDSQIYCSFKTANKTNQAETANRFKKCLNDIESWMKDNMLKLNTDKTEVIMFTSKNHIIQIVQLTDANIFVGMTVLKDQFEVIEVTKKQITPICIIKGEER
jgi:hypothetical protein